MNRSINKVAKAVLLLGALHYGSNFVYDLGKARMFGAIAAENSEVMDVLQSFHNYEYENLPERLRMNLITSVALFTAKKGTA